MFRVEYERRARIRYLKNFLKNLGILRKFLFDEICWNFRNFPEITEKFGRILNDCLGKVEEYFAQILLIFKRNFRENLENIHFESF